MCDPDDLDEGSTSDLSMVCDTIDALIDLIDHVAGHPESSPFTGQRILVQKMVRAKTLAKGLREVIRPPERKDDV